MKTSSVSLLLLCTLAIFACVAKAQDCGFTVGNTILNFSADPGTTDTLRFTITNTSTQSINIWITQLGSSPFRVIDSDFTIAQGNSKSGRVFFAPGKTATGVFNGRLLASIAFERCFDTIFLNGVVKTNLCLETEHELSYVDPVIIGGSATHEFKLINQSGAAITVTGVTLDNSLNSDFTITSPMPIIVPPHSSDHLLTYSFSPQSDYQGTFFNTTFCTIQESGDSSNCPFITELLIGNVARPGGGSGIDTTVRGLFPSETRTLAAVGSGKPVKIQYSFRNNLSVPVTVKNVYMKYGTYFSVAGTNPSPLPFSLSQDQDMTVTVNFTATDNFPHTDSLLIDAEHNLQTISFPIQGEQVPPNSVSSNALPEGISISIAPNPASGIIKIDVEGIRSSALEICDLLGKPVASGKTDRIWTWDSDNASEGAYIVRITGESFSGQPFVTSKRIIVKR